MNTHFKAPWGYPLLLQTALILIVLSVVSLLGIHRFEKSPIGLAFTPVFWISLILVGYWVCSMIVGYQVNGSSLIIRRLGWSNTISISGLTECVKSPYATSWLTQAMSGPRLPLISGCCWSEHLGSYRDYVTDQKLATILCLPNQCIIISPDDPAAFIEAMKPHLTPP